MRALFFAVCLLAPLWVSPSSAGLGVCDLPGSTCSTDTRCTLASLACEQDSGVACSGNADGHHKTSFAGGASMEVTCSGTASSSRISLIVLTWEQYVSGSSKTTNFAANSGAFSWRSTPDGCTMATSVYARPCIANLAPPTPPVPAGQVLP